MANSNTITKSKGVRLGYDRDGNLIRHHLVLSFKKDTSAPMLYLEWMIDHQSQAKISNNVEQGTFEVVFKNMTMAKSAYSYLVNNL